MKLDYSLVVVAKGCTIIRNDKCLAICSLRQAKNLNLMTNGTISYAVLIKKKKKHTSYRQSDRVEAICIP